MSARSSTEVGSSSRMTRWPLGAAPPASAPWRARPSGAWRSRGRRRACAGRRRARPWRAAARPRHRAAPVDEAEARELLLVAEIDVLADGQVGQQRLLLEHHADALAAGVGGVAQAHRLAGEQDLRRRPAGRRRPGCASASTCRRRSRRSGPTTSCGRDLEADTLQRMDAGEALVDVLRAPARGGHLTILVRARSRRTTYRKLPLPHAGSSTWMLAISPMNLINNASVFFDNRFR